MMSISISVILPFYNGSKFIEATLDSILNQTLSPLEIIIVDDGSDLEEVRALDSIDDNRILIIHQENAGVSVARNTGIANSRGDWIAFIDQDDHWESSKLELQCAYLENNPECKALHTAVTSVKTNGRIVNYRKKQLFLNDFLLKGFPNPAYLSSTIIARASLMRAGLFNPIFKYSQDSECFLRCSLLFPFHYLDEPLTIRHHHDTNLSEDNRGVWADQVRIIRLYERIFENRTLFRKRLYTMHGEFALVASRNKNWRLFFEIFSELPRENFSRILFLCMLIKRRFSEH